MYFAWQLAILIGTPYILMTEQISTLWLAYMLLCET